MDVADQVLAYLRVLTWPVTVSLAIVLFRGSIRGLLGGVEEFEGFGVKAKIRQRVTDGTTAAEQALDGSPIGQAPMNQQRVAPHLITVIPRVEEALTVSTQLAGEMPGPPDDPLREMRSVLNWLDT